MKDTTLHPAIAGPPRPNAAQPAAPAAEGGTIRPSPGAEPGKDLPVRQPPEAPDPDLSGVVESLNDYLQSVRRDLRFSVDDATGRTVITVLHSDSKEVIREIPPESVQALAAYLRSEGFLDSFGVAEEA